MSQAQRRNNAKPYLASSAWCDVNRAAEELQAQASELGGRHPGGAPVATSKCTTCEAQGVMEDARRIRHAVTREASEQLGLAPGSHAVPPPFMLTHPLLLTPGKVMASFGELRGGCQPSAPRSTLRVAVLLIDKDAAGPLLEKSSAYDDLLGTPGLADLFEAATDIGAETTLPSSGATVNCAAVDRRASLRDHRAA